MRPVQFRTVELTKPKTFHHPDRNQHIVDATSFPGRNAHLRRRGEDRQGWQTGTSKFLAQSKACGLTMDRQAHRQNSGRCCGNQQQGQGVSGLDDRQMLNEEAGQLSWTLRSRRDGSPFRPVLYAAAFGTSNVPCRKESSLPHASRQGARIRSRSAVGFYRRTHQGAPAPPPTAQHPCSRVGHG